jgi:hypothetical protein
MPDAKFQAEAVQRAEAKGYYPAEGQREVDWDEVAAWAERVQQTDFIWLKESEMSGCGYIILGANRAIASGQHRILGGLMGNHPVPEESISYLSCEIPVQPWR